MCPFQKTAAIYIRKEPTWCSSSVVAGHLLIWLPRYMASACLATLMGGCQSPHVNNQRQQQQCHRRYVVVAAIITAAPAMHQLSTSNPPTVLEETGKHAAQDTLPAVPAKHPRSLELSSINGILRQHARQRLYVRPLHSTAEHLHLLGCEFITDPRAVVGKLRKETEADGELIQSVAEATRFLDPRVLTELELR